MALPSAALLAQSILSGIFIGALYGLLGLGLSLSWGILRQINLAHFALAFLGAYLCYQLSAVGGMDPLATMLVIVPCFFAIGIAVQWLFARFRISAFNSLLVTFGLTVIIESVIQSIWTADFRRLPSVYGDTTFRVGALYVPMPELLTFVLSLTLSLANLGGASLHGPWPCDACSRGGWSDCRRVRREPEGPRAAAVPACARPWPASRACASR